MKLALIRSNETVATGECFPGATTADGEAVVAAMLMFLLLTKDSNLQFKSEKCFVRWNLSNDDHDAATTTAQKKKTKKNNRLVRAF